VQYFIDTHDRSKGSFPAEAVTREEFLATYSGFDAALEEEGGFATGAHLNLSEGKAFCLTCASDVSVVAAAHEKIGMPYDSITQIQRVSGMDLR
jgi:hypothetical protein